MKGQSYRTTALFSTSETYHSTWVWMKSSVSTSGLEPPLSTATDSASRVAWVSARGFCGGLTHVELSQVRYKAASDKQNSFLWFVLFSNQRFQNGGQRWKITNLRYFKTTNNSYIPPPLHLQRLCKWKKGLQSLNSTSIRKKFFISFIHFVHLVNFIHSIHSIHFIHLMHFIHSIHFIHFIHFVHFIP